MVMVVKYLTQLLPVLLALTLTPGGPRPAAADEHDPDAAASKKTKQIDEEEHEIGYVQSLLVDATPVASRASAYQDIAVYDSPHFGKVFLLDDCLQLTERDAPHYNEMLAHVPVMEYAARRAAPEARGGAAAPLRALVVGGGDGYVVSELLKHPHIGAIDHVELDAEVIEVAKEHLPWGAAWESDRVNLVIADGAAFVKEQARKGHSYHIVIQDASDPFYLEKDGSVVTLPSSVLYGASHFESLYQLLRPTEGVLMFQAETYNIPSNLRSIREWRRLLETLGFATPRYGTIAVGTYPTGQIGFFAAHARDGAEGGRTCAGDAACGAAGGAAPRDARDVMPESEWQRLVAQFDALDGKTRYYHPRVHRSSFDLPLWVEEYIYGNV